MTKPKPIKALKEEDELRAGIEKRATNTAFILMFPALILAGIAVFYAPVYIGFLAILLAVYQFLMLKKFVEDFYLNR